jgi:hypothetical protein
MCGDISRMEMPVWLMEKGMEAADWILRALEPV